jgi:hypothetical protein
LFDKNKAVSLASLTKVTDNSKTKIVKKPVNK